MKQESFEKELGMAQRMARLYREAKEERAAKCTELEGVVQELKQHMEVGRRQRGRDRAQACKGREWLPRGLQALERGCRLGAARAPAAAVSTLCCDRLLPALQSSRAAAQEALAKEEEARHAAEQLVAEERVQRQRMLAAAASGNLPMLAAAGGGTPGGASAARGSPGMSPGASDASADAGLSATELYSKYVEMHERYRAERLRNRQQEIVMEELCSEVEKRAALVKEQQVGGRRLAGCWCVARCLAASWLHRWRLPEGPPPSTRPTRHHASPATASCATYGAGRV